MMVDVHANPFCTAVTDTVIWINHVFFQHIFLNGGEPRIGIRCVTIQHTDRKKLEDRDMNNKTSKFYRFIVHISEIIRHPCFWLYILSPHMQLFDWLKPYKPQEQTFISIVL